MPRVPEYDDVNNNLETLENWIKGMIQCFTFEPQLIGYP